MHLFAPRILLALSLVLPAGCSADASGGQPNGQFASETPGTGVGDIVAASPPERPLQVAQQKTTVPAPVQAGNDVKELDWDALIPPDWNPEKLIDQYDASDLSDSDPKAKALLKKIKRLWDEAPVVESLNGQRVKLPGFVVPLEMNAKSIDEFLLVPYYGACIHVPPPPTNQTVYVIAPPGKPFEGQLFDTVWVTGEMKVEKYSNEMGNAGYSIHASKIEPYE